MCVHLPKEIILDYYYNLETNQVSGVKKSWGQTRQTLL